MNDAGYNDATSQPRVPLRRLLWGSYLRTALIPLFVIEVSFLATYWVSGLVVYRKNVEAVSALSRQYFNDVALREAANISSNLDAIASLTEIYARQTREALDQDYVPPASERARYQRLPSGGIYTSVDNGTTASFYAGGTRVGKKELRKVWQLSALDPLMMSIKDSNINIASIYVNTFDSYNRIYPYVETISQYSSDMDIPSYNFYYEADGKHNPERKQVWTEAYVDPAGHGWMVSSIAPVWRGGTLEGVVGIDVTLDNIIKNLLDLDLPWNGYAILVDEEGGIIALAPGGEQDFQLAELTDHDYSKAILSDMRKPDEFNLYNRVDTRQLAEAMRQSTEGTLELDVGGGRLASFATVPQTGWHLVIVAPTENIFEQAQGLNDRLKAVGYIMLAALVVFYLLFFVYLTIRAKRISGLIAEPLAEVSRVIDDIAGRRKDIYFRGSNVEELDKLGRHLSETRRKLIIAEEEALRQTEIAQRALVRVREANAEMFSFARFMSHEIRTPLSIIDGSAQIIDRKADQFGPDDLRTRAVRLRSAVSKVTDMLSTLLERFETIAMDSSSPGLDEKSAWGEFQAALEGAAPPKRLHIAVSGAAPYKASENEAFLLAVKEVVTYVLCDAPSDQPIGVELNGSAIAFVAVISAKTARSAKSDLDKISNYIISLGGHLSCEQDSGKAIFRISVPTFVRFVN